VQPIAVWGKGKPLLLWPDGKLYRDLSHKAYPGEGHAAVSPDGKRVALLIRQPGEMIGPRWAVRIHQLYIRGVNEKGPGVEMPTAGLTLGDRLRWSRDGRRLYAETGTLLPELRKAVAAGEAANLAPSRPVVFDIAKTTWSFLPLPADHHSFLGERADGKLLTCGAVTVEVTSRDGKRLEYSFRNVLRPFWRTPERKSSALLPRDRGESDDTAVCHLSADGKRLLYFVVDEKRSSCRLRVADLKTGQRTDLATDGLPEKDFGIGRARWSPDGKRIAFCFVTIEAAEKAAAKDEDSPEASLCVCDADGKNMKVIRKGKADELANFEWR
jgi:dipeptidyl aminopeptidase/acylaminoacyl peptidase